VTQQHAECYQARTRRAVCAPAQGKPDSKAGHCESRKRYKQRMRQVQTRTLAIARARLARRIASATGEVRSTRGTDQGPSKERMSAPVDTGLLAAALAMDDSDNEGAGQPQRVQTDAQRKASAAIASATAVSGSAEADVVPQVCVCVWPAVCGPAHGAG